VRDADTARTKAKSKGSIAVTRPTLAVDTRALILNEQKIADRSSRMDLRKNADGSVDIYCGPKAPAGFETNWIPTVPGKNWFAYFRFYQPTEAYFDRSWPLPDFEQS
jgi:hypothetical protein